MRFVYYYKTSDGVRHSDEMSAPNKEAVFSALRERGIKAIKVELPGGLKPEEIWRRRLVVSVGVVLVLGVCAGFGVSAYLTREKPVDAAVSADVKQDGRLALLKLQEKVRAARDRHTATMRLVDWDCINDYRALSRPEGRNKAKRALSYARSGVAQSRLDLRTVFDYHYGGIPEEAVAERNEAQILYGEVMSEIDADEIRVENGESVLAEIERNPDFLKSRWHRDFRK